MTLLFGIGNSARSDDGLGWAFLEKIEQESFFDGQIEYRFQLQVEDAALISTVDHVIFVDSFSGDLPEGYEFDVCEPSADFEYTSHVLAPQAVLALGTLGRLRRDLRKRLGSTLRAQDGEQGSSDSNDAKISQREWHRFIL